MSYNTDLKDSLKVLMTLYVMLNNDFEALVFYSKHLSEENLERDLNNIPNKEKYLDSTIIDSLRFSIILKSCSFLDEWDKFLGVRTETEHNQRLELIKKSVAKARRAINEWKDLRDFRNEIVAHNFRGKDRVVKIDFMKNYNCPQTIPELYYLVSFLERMINVLTVCYSDNANEIVADFGKLISINQDDYPISNLKKMKDTLDEIDEDISEKIFQIYGYDLATSLSSSIKK